MVCSNCGCPLTDGVSVFCPECGQKVQNGKNEFSSGQTRALLLVLVVLSLSWLFFPILRIAGDKISTLSALNLLMGKGDFSGLKISGQPLLAPIFILPQLGCIIALFCKKCNIHRLYSVVGIIEFYNSLFLSVILVAFLRIPSSFNGLFGYGTGIIINLAFSMIIAFLCMSLSAAQVSNRVSRSEKWFLTVNWANLICSICILFVFVFCAAYFSALRSQWLFDILTVLSLFCFSLASYKMIKKEFSQWMLFVMYGVLSAGTNFLLFFTADNMIKAFVGKSDAFGIYDFLSPNVKGITLGISAFALIFCIVMSIWSYATLKRNIKIYKTRNIAK